MPQATGANAQIIYDEESTYKSDPGTPAAKILPFKSESLRLSRNLIDSEALLASRSAKKPVRGNLDVLGAIELEMNPYIGTILKHALGVNVDSGAGPYVHTIKVGTLPVGLVIEKGFTDLTQFFKYNGCRINKLSMSLAAEGVIAGSVDIIGAKETVGGSSFDATPTDLGHLPFDGFEGTLEEGGSSIAYVQSVDFVLENNLDGNSYVIGGSGERRALPSGKTKVSGTLKALFESVTLYNKAVAHSESSLKAILSRGNGLGTAGNESLETFVPELIFEPNAPVISGPQGILVELPFTGYYDNSTEAAAMQMILKNTQTTI